MEKSMSSSNPTLSDMQHAVRDTVRVHWQLFLTQGVIMVILGVLAVVWPQISTIAVDVYVGWLFLLSGIVGLASMFLAQNVPAFLWSLLTAALSLIVGMLLLWQLAEGAVSLPLVLTAFFIVEGIFQISASISYRGAFPDSWEWMLTSGITDLILAALIIKGWPNTAGWALGLIVGVNLITSGWAIVCGAQSRPSHRSSRGRMDLVVLNVAGSTSWLADAERREPEIEGRHRHRLD
jgi:uncharacterized membrane protein HdeD (DUF308 family)